MIKLRTGKGRGVMTDRTILCRWNMIGRLTGSETRVVARGTVINNTGMIEYRVRKRTRHMADATIFVCRYVGGMFWRSRWCNTPVTRRTIIYNTGMVKCGARKASSVMTDTAIVDCWNMGSR